MVSIGCLLHEPIRVQSQLGHFLRKDDSCDRNVLCIIHLWLQGTSKTHLRWRVSNSLTPCSMMEREESSQPTLSRAFCSRLRGLSSEFLASGVAGGDIARLISSRDGPYTHMHTQQFSLGPKAMKKEKSYVQ